MLLSPIPQPFIHNVLCCKMITALVPSLSHYVYNLIILLHWGSPKYKTAERQLINQPSRMRAQRC